LPALGNKEDALKYFTDIAKITITSEAASVDVLIGLAL
jgi:hypothetical protein